MLWVGSPSSREGLHFIDTCSSACYLVLRAPKVVPSCGGFGMGWELSCVKHAFSLEPLFTLLFCGLVGFVFHCNGPVGLSLTLILIPGVEWNNCELYFPFCGLKRILCYRQWKPYRHYLQHSFPEVNKVNSRGSQKLNLIEAQFCISSVKS